MTKARSNATAEAAKGDLRVGNGTNLSGILAVGNNGETIVADSSTATGLRYQANFAAGKNKIINGDFGIWQRGTSFSNPANEAYTADRWKIQYNGSGITRTISQQSFTAGTAPVAGYEGQFFLRVDTTAAGTGNTYTQLVQQIEDVRTLAGQTVTLSYWAKAATSFQVTPVLVQQFGSGGSGEVGTNGTTVNLTTSWTRYTTTVVLPSIAGKTIGANSSLRWTFTLPVNAAFTFDIWGVQVEAGSVATAFQTATGTIQGELAACKYYYRRQGGSTAFEMMGMGTASSTTVANILVPFDSPMRVAPTSVDYSTLRLTDLASGYTVTALALDANFNSKNLGVVSVTVASGLTVGKLYYLDANNSTSAYLGFSSEL